MNKKAKVKIILGSILALVILSYSLYIVFDDKIRIDVEKTRTKYSINSDGNWVTAGTEYVYLFDGSTKMRAKNRSITYHTVDNLTKITRESNYKDKIKLIDIYEFDSTVTDIELVPIKRDLICFNCKGKIVHFEYRDISYDGITREAKSPESFGYKMKVEWEDGYDWAKVTQSKYASDKLVIRYRPLKETESYSVRMFDPPLLEEKVSYEKCVEEKVRRYYIETGYKEEIAKNGSRVKIHQYDKDYHIICTKSISVLKINGKEIPRDTTEFDKCKGDICYTKKDLDTYCNIRTKECHGNKQRISAIQREIFI